MKSIVRYLLCALIAISGATGAQGMNTPKTSTANATEARVRVSASIKTHSSRYHVAERTTRGTSGYTLEMIIDETAYKLAAVPRNDSVSYGDRQHPEEGRGIRFNFSGDFSVSPGKHRVTFRLPEDNVSVTTDVDFVPGDNYLVVSPTYAKIPRNRIIGFRGNRHFSQHVAALTVSVSAGK